MAATAADPHDAEPPHRFSNARTSVASRVSKLFGIRRDNDLSQRTSAACEVPIFMSPSSDHLERDPQMPAQSNTGQCREQRMTVTASSVYSESPGRQHQTRFMEQMDEGNSYVLDENHDVEQGTPYPSYLASESLLTGDKRRRRRRVRESTRQKIAGKRKLSMAFGVTLLATIITYLALAVTNTAHGLMFHVLSVLFILLLTGVFLHSFIRMIMLQKRRNARRAQHRNWHGSAGGSSLSGSSRSYSSSAGDPFADPAPEKPVEIHMGPEEVVTTTPRGKNTKVVRQPPPVYGNFRESKRMNPQMVFWHKPNPSPATPTYEQALNDVQTAVGYQPPEYVSPKRERQRGNDRSMSNFHPLERERLAGLMGNTMSSQR